MIIKAKKHTKINIKHPYEIWSVEIKKKRLHAKIPRKLIL